MNEDIRAKFKATLRGEWVGGVTYSFFDAVLYEGNVYFALRNNNSSRPDICHDDWILSIGEGPQGEQGIQGEKGEMGDIPAHAWNGTSIAFEKPNGTMGTFVNIQGAQGERGSQGLKGEKGDKGDKGDTGPQGEQGIKGERGDTASICVPPLIIAPMAALPNSSIAITITLAQNHHYLLPLEGFYLSVIGDGDSSNNAEPFYIPSPGGLPYDYTFSPQGAKDDVIQIRAAIVDMLGNISNFSEAEILLTAPLVFPPSITSPSNYGTNVPYAFTLDITEIENVAGITPMGVGTHVQIATDAAFTDIVFDTTSSMNYETNVSVSGLVSYTQYYARARHRDAVYGWSAWSDIVTFKTVYEGYVKTSGVWVAPESGEIEVTLVGGGGGGGGTEYFASTDTENWLDGGQGGLSGAFGGTDTEHYFYHHGGGGGAGGIVSFTTTVTKNTPYPCIVGKGGGLGENGEDSTFNGRAEGTKITHRGGNGGSGNNGGNAGVGTARGGNAYHIDSGYDTILISGGGGGGWIGDGLSSGGQGGETINSGKFAESGQSNGYGGRGTQAGFDELTTTYTGGKPYAGFGGGGSSSDRVMSPNAVPDTTGDVLQVLRGRNGAGGGGAGYGAGGGGNARRQEPELNIYVQGGHGADGVIFIRYFPS